MSFSASLDLLAWVITISVVVVILGIELFLVKHPPRKSHWVTLILAYGLGMILPLAILVTAFIHRPMNYEVRDDKIIIRRPIGDFVIDIREIKNMSNLDRRVSSTLKRTNASGGLFGYFGEVKDGWDQMYHFFATRRDRYVLIETTKGERYVLSPDDMDFVKLLEPLYKKSL